MKSFSAAPTASYCCWNLAGLEVFQQCLQTMHQMDVLVHKSRHRSSTAEQIISYQRNLRLEIFYAEIQLIWPVCPLRLKSTAKSISVLLMVACSLRGWISLQSQSAGLNKSKCWILHLPQAMLSCESWCHQPICLLLMFCLEAELTAAIGHGQRAGPALQTKARAGPSPHREKLFHAGESGSPIADSEVWRREKNLFILLFYFILF